jgi:periplasmic divalent cation tolerance protein
MADTAIGWEDALSYVQIQFAIDDVTVADGIVEGLLRDHLIACGQRTGRITSRYWWRESLQQAEEWLVLLKTRAELAPAVVDAVVQRHPYETPEVIVLPIAGGAADYLAWIESVTS